MLDPEINGKDYNKSDHSSPNLAMSGGFLEGVSNFLTKGSTTILLGVVFVVVLFAEITMMSGAETVKVEVDLYSVCVTAIATGSVALLFAYYLGKQVIAMPTGTIKMQEIATAIQEGATAFLKQEYKWLSMFVAVVAALITVFMGDPATAVAFVTGAFISGVTGWIGMAMAVRGNVRTAAAAVHGLDPALRVAFNTGSVMGMMVVGSGLIGVSLLLIVFSSLYEDVALALQHLAGFGFGASSIALFARVGGGIYTKAADVGADLVGKVEAGIPEDDPRNPATIADCVGDNVGDTAGMGADLFESYVGSIIAASALGYEVYGDAGVALPLYIAAAGIVSSIFGTLYVRTKDGASQEDLLKSLRNGVLSAGACIIAFAGMIVQALGFQNPLNLFSVILVGLVAGFLVGQATEYATSGAYYPVKSIAKSSETGPATVLISGLAVGMFSTVPPIAILTAAIMICLKLAGVYGVAIGAVGMLSTLGVTLSTDAYGPVVDNAGGIAEMAELDPEVRDRTDALDALGNTTAATGKGFAIGSAVLTSLALLVAFQKEVSSKDHPLVADIVDTSDNKVMPGMLIGGVLPYIFSGFTMLAVGRSAGSVIEEVRRQFALGILEGTAKPDYGACVDIVTRASLREMVAPGVMACVAPVVFGMMLGPEGLVGLLTGGILSGSLMAIMMSNAGGAWDNCKKYIEAGKHGGKGSDCHKAAVVGDTVGDPFKDTSGPALNILIKLMSIISLVMAPYMKAHFAVDAAM